MPSHAPHASAFPIELAELFHPDGRAGRVSFVGPSDAAAATKGRADLLVLAPTAAEWRSLAWRATASRVLENSLAPHGIVWALAPARRSRRALCRLVVRCGLNVAERVVHVPNRRSSSHLVPLRAGPVQYALRQVPGGRLLAPALVRLPAWRGLLEQLVPDVAFVAQRAQAPRPACWLGRATGDGRTSSHLVRASWRGANGATIVLRFNAESPEPSLVAKVMPPAAEARARAEADALATIAPTAARAGIDVPELAGILSLGDRAVVVAHPLRGHSAASLLAREPTRLDSLLTRLGEWLDVWNLATSELRPLGPAELEAAVLAPGQTLGSLVSPSYLEWLRGRCQALTGVLVPRVAAHNDLTMWNVLVAPSGRLGILDWEEAKADSLPLGDIAYAAVDAVAATRGYATRPVAFADCFAPGGAHRGRALALVRRSAERLELERNAATLCFHACWLRHAANEQVVAPRGDASFLEIVRLLSTGPFELMDRGP